MACESTDITDRLADSSRFLTISTDRLMQNNIEGNNKIAKKVFLIIKKYLYLTNLFELYKD